MARRVAPARRLVVALLGVLGAVAVLATPLALVGSGARLVIYGPQLYEYGFAAYNIPTVTGLPLDQLLSAAAQTRDYFLSPAEPLAVKVERNGETVDLYNQREVAHMTDVKVIMQGVERLRLGATGYLLFLLVVGLLLQRRRYPSQFGGVLVRGGAFTLGLAALVGVGAVLDFDALFLQFHLVSFSNDLWLLDPRRDYLIMMYPSEFFRDATLAIGGVTLLLTGLTLSVGVVLMTRGRPRSRFTLLSRNLREGDPELLLAGIGEAVTGLRGWFESALYPDEVQVGDWTAKDLLAQLVYRHLVTAEALEETAAGDPAAQQALDTDAGNAMAAAQYRDTPVAELLTMLDTAHARVVAASRAIPSAETVVRVRADGSSRTLRQQFLVRQADLRERLAELRRATIEGAGG